VFLIDTCVWLEELLSQDKSDEVCAFLRRVPSDHLAISDFSFHSVGIALCRGNRAEAFIQFAQDLFVEGSVSLVSVDPHKTKHVVDVIARFGLDFDDAYQYCAAETDQLQIVSFDSDFDKTDRPRITPANVR